MVPKKEDPAKACEACGAALARKRFKERLEDRGVFLRRRFCSPTCSGLHHRKVAPTQSALLKRARAFLKKACERCGASSKTDMLAAHHRDENRQNNAPANIQTLCVTCHAWWHHEAKRRGISPAGPAPILA